MESPKVHKEKGAPRHKRAREQTTNPSGAEAPRSGTKRAKRVKGQANHVGNPDQEASPYSSLTLKQLVPMCRERGIKVTKGRHWLTRPMLLAALREHGAQRGKQGGNDDEDRPKAPRPAGHRGHAGALPPAASPAARRAAAWMGPRGTGRA